MILAKTYFLLAALVAPNQPIAVAVAVQPGAVKSRVAPFDPALLRQALVRELAAAGIAIGNSPDLPRLVVQVTLVDPGDVLALEQKAAIAADVQLLQPGMPDRPTTTIAVPPANCAGQAKFGLLSTPGQRARLALARCIDQLAGQISASVAGSTESVVVR
jgi:hypothetical protein